MVNVVTQIQINKPVEQVADFVSNPDNAPKWYANIKSVIWKTGKPLVVGSKIAFRAHFLSRELVYTYEVMDYVKNEIDDEYFTRSFSNDDYLHLVTN